MLLLHCLPFTDVSSYREKKKKEIQHPEDNFLKDSKRRRKKKIPPSLPFPINYWEKTNFYSFIS